MYFANIEHLLDQKHFFCRTFLCRILGYAQVLVFSSQNQNFLYLYVTVIFLKNVLQFRDGCGHQIQQE